MSDPQIIRTQVEFDALDPDTMLYVPERFTAWPAHCIFSGENALPAVVLATGEEARAARQALKEATE